MKASKAAKRAINPPATGAKRIRSASKRAREALKAVPEDDAAPNEDEYSPGELCVLEWLLEYRVQ